MRHLIWAIAVVGVITGAVARTADAAGKCTSIQARCALEVGGECDPQTGRWAYGNWGGKRRGGMANRGGAFDACISRELARKKSR